VGNTTSEAYSITEKTMASPCNSTAEAFSFAKVEELLDGLDENNNRDVVDKTLVEYMNHFFAIVKGTSATYIEKTLRKRFDSPAEIEYVFRCGRGFKDSLANKTIVIRTKTRSVLRNRVRDIVEEETVNLYDLWSKSRYRSEFDRLIFSKGHEATSFNLYHGLSVEQQNIDDYDGSQALPWIEHIKHIWCRDDEALFEYVMLYFAHLIQKPFVKTRVALVLKSRQGAGKGVILTKIREIFGRYFKTLKPKEFLGEFNGVLSDCLVLFLDECVFSGDKRTASELKCLITEDTHQINNKYLPSTTLENHINVIMATNYAWCAPIEESDRRYFAIELDDKYAGRSTKESTAYFKDIIDVPYQAVYLFLMSLDISGFIPNHYPVTNLMRTQKIYTMESVTSWVYHSLSEGASWTAFSTILKTELYSSYSMYAKEMGGHYAKIESFPKFISTAKSIIGYTDLSRTDVELPDIDVMKKNLRTYLDDPDFPIDD
jgi:hypothetical protein